MRFLSFVVFLLVALSPSLIYSQSTEKEAFLFIDNKPVFPKEFIRLYQKNLNVITDERQKDLDNYLNLFINYKLKLTEAKELGLDENSEYLKDITAYRKDITLEYLEDSQISKAILEDMYQRSLKEVHVSHILINLPTYAYGKDTVSAYNRLNALRERAIAGENFNQLAVKHSEEPAAKKTKGDLGYFSTMQMVMSFEDAAYNTQVGDVSPIIRTGYGYHILKVHGERPKENKLKAAHIMIMKSKDTVADEKRIQEAYLALREGKRFSNVAQMYSQDGATSKNGGELEDFGRKDIKLKAFTNMAYSLKEGEYSAPFKSDIGWHIVLLKERLPQPTKDEVLKQIKKFFEASGSNAFYNQKKHNKLLTILQYELLLDNYTTDLLTYIDRDYVLKKRKPIRLSNTENKKMFKLREHTFHYNDFLRFIGERKQYATEGMRTEQILHEALENFKKEKALEVFSDKLYIENMEYAARIDEYNDGILLFDLMQDQVWRKAAKDTLAQKEYYKKHQSEFDLPESWEVLIYETKDKVVANGIQEKLNANLEKETINNELDVSPRTETWSKNSKELKSNSFHSNQSINIINEGDLYLVVEVQRHTPKMERGFDAAKNDVSQAYTVAFEKQWTQALRDKYKVKLKKKKWKNLKSELL